MLSTEKQRWIWILFFQKNLPLLIHEATCSKDFYKKNQGKTLKMSLIQNLANYVLGH